MHLVAHCTELDTSVQRKGVGMDGPVLLLDRPVAAMTPGAGAAWYQALEQTDEKHEEGHKRHRARLDGHESRIESLEQAHADLQSKVLQLSGRQVSLTDIIVPSKVVWAIVLSAVMIAGGIWASTSELRSDVRDILTQQAASAKMADERSGSLKESIADAKRLQELQRIQLESLTKTVLTMQRR